MKRTFQKSDKRDDYVPPFLGNGDITFRSDIHGIDSYIWRAGYRYRDSLSCDLIPFDKVTQTVGDNIALSDWQQTLDTVKANVKTVSFTEISVSTARSSFTPITI